MSISVHPFISGHPFRMKHIEAALGYIASHSAIWRTTGGEIKRLVPRSLHERGNRKARQPGKIIRSRGRQPTHDVCGVQYGEENMARSLSRGVGLRAFVLPDRAANRGRRHADGDRRARGNHRDGGEATENLQKADAASHGDIPRSLWLMRAITDLRQAQMIVPSVRFQAEGNNTQVFIRGVGANLDFANVEPNVAFNLRRHLHAARGHQRRVLRRAAAGSSARYAGHLVRSQCHRGHDQYHADETGLQQ